MGKVLKFFGYYLLGLMGILLISTAPALFRQREFLSISNYINELQMLFSSILKPSEWTYLFKGSPVPLLEHLWEPYTYSMTVFFGGIFLGFLLAFAGAFLTVFLPKWIQSAVSRLLGVLESIPDLLLAFSFQLFIVWLYRKTEILLIPFVALGQEKVYALPILAIAALPMVMMYRVLLMLIEEEWTASYVQMAKGKGLEKYFILSVHILRNIIKSAFYHSKIIIWGSLSSLLIIEYIFNMNGITTAFLDDFRPIVSSVILFLLFTPFFVIYQGTELFIFKDRRAVEEADTQMNRFISAPSFKRGGTWMKYVLEEVLAHFKNPKFLLGFLVIFGTVAISIIYSSTADPLIDQYRHIYEDDKLVSTSPHTPEYVFLGTDEFGFSVLDQLVIGAKYTIIFALAIAFFRLIFGFLLAIPYAFFLPVKVQRVLEKIVDGMHFLPMTIIAYILLYPVLWMPPDGFSTTEGERILYQGIILTLLAVPLLVTLLGNEMKLVMKEEFVTSTKVLGGSSVHLLWRHLLPHLSARMGVVFGQQFIQTLLIFIHLGVFDIFFGGTKVSYDPNWPDPPISTTYEWSGLIGAAKNSLMTGRWWLIIPVLVCFMVIILSMQLVIQGMKEVQQRRVGVPVDQNTWLKRLLRRRPSAKRETRQVHMEDFEFTHTKRKHG
ncbi:ABC transporter permease [Halobacillus litoralis]|uniref:ABC transporter permease n=1 Tax=Halobacillus litoralis TaxID=45668 RepID=UPI001CFE0123|nr:ABC transporter permease [Halobacillus litoralis]